MLKNKKEFDEWIKWNNLLNAEFNLKDDLIDFYEEEVTCRKSDFDKYKNNQYFADYDEEDMFDAYIIEDEIMYDNIEDETEETWIYLKQ